MQKNIISLHSIILILFVLFGKSVCNPSYSKDYISSRQLTTLDNSSILSVENEKKCTPEKVIKVRKCMLDLLPLLNFGIPSNRYETETACNSFFTAITCMTEFSKFCLNDSEVNRLNTHVAPAFEMYSHICKDKQSRAQFYRHGECYRRITAGYDVCADDLAIGIGSIKEEENRGLITCCHQRNFLKCVLHSLVEQKCDNSSIKTTYETAKKTVPEQIQRENGTNGICISMTDNQCVKLGVSIWKYRSTNTTSSSSLARIYLITMSLLYVMVMNLFYNKVDGKFSL